MPFDPSKVDFSSLSQVAPNEQDEDLFNFERATGDDLRFTMGEAGKINPDEHVKVTELSRDTGLPDFVVRDNIDKAETIAGRNQFDFSDLVKRSPKTTEFLLDDFNNAVVAQDDLDILQEIEGWFDFDNTFENIGESISLGFEAGSTGIQAVGVDTAPDRIADIVPMGAMPIGMENEAIDISRQIAKNLGVETDDDLVRLKEEATQEMIVKLRDLQGQQEALSPEDLNLLEQGVRSGVESLAHMAPGFALMLLSGGRAAPMLATMGVQTFSSSYGSGRAEGLTPEQAGWYASIDAAIEVGTEVLPTGTIERMLTGKSGGMTKAALKFMVQEMGTEQLATLGQSMNATAFDLDEQLNDPTLSIEEKVQIQLQRQAVTAIATVVAGGAQVTAVTGIRKSIEALQSDEQQKATKSQVEQRKIDDLNEKSTQSKLRERNKESFKQFIEQSDESNTHVFIDGAQAALYLQSKTSDEIKADPALTMLSEQVREASRLGNDVQIPVADFAADFAGTDHFNELRDTMTLSGDTIAPFRQEQVQQETDAYIQNLMNEAQENVSEYVEAQEIFTRVRDQLVDSGQVNPQNASIMAQLVPAWATAQAKRTGKTVQQVYEDSGLTIEGPQTGERARLEGEQVLSQEPVKDKNLLIKSDGTTVSEEDIAYIMDENRWLDVGLKIGKKTKLYRGSSVGDAYSPNNESGMSTQGRGLYTTTDKKQAKEYGEIFEMDHFALPEKPIRFADELNYSNWLAIIRDRLGFRRSSDFESTNGGAIDEWVRRIDPTIDGIQIGTGAGAYFVKFPEQETFLEQRTKKQARGYYDPATSVIRLTEASDLSTFLHEFAHFMYEMELKNDTGLTESINNWYKRNAADVAEEANGYLGEQFDALKQGGVKQPWQLTREEYEKPVELKEQQSFFFNIGGNKVEVIRNPSSSDIRALTKESIEKYGKPGQGDPVLRFTEDMSGNTYRWSAFEAIHATMEPLIKSREGVDVNQNANEKSSHRSVVRRALYNGENVPENIVNEYPGLIDDVKSIPGNKVSEVQFAQPTTPPTAKEGSITAEKVIEFLDLGTTGDKDQDAAIRRAVHEQFARGFETYLMEGKAPSVELRNVFRTFARWLVQIYKSIRGQLNVKLDDDIRQVFDRLLATEEQIAAANARARVEPLFTNAAMAGMTEEQFADYQKQQEKVKDVETETLRDKIIAQLTLQTQNWWEEEKQDLINEELKSLEDQKVYTTRKRLKYGDIKLDLATVKEMVGVDEVDELNRKSRVIPTELGGMTAPGKKGVHPDEAAAFFGYNSGSEMINDLIKAPPIKEVADANAQQKMIERHGDIMTDGTIEREADEAVQNEERGKLILKELKILAKGTNIPVTDRMIIKAAAEDNIGKLSFKQIHPAKYRRAEIRAAQEAARMLAEGNKEGAAQAKLRQVMNYYLGMAATNARNETTDIVDRMARYNKKNVREAIQKAENGYWEQLTGILSRFEFRKSASLKETESLNIWLKERIETDGDGLVLSNAVLNESYVTHWKNIPFSDLQGVNESVKNIEHVARYANKMKVAGEEIEFQKLISSLVTHIKSVNESEFKPAEAIEITKDQKGVAWATSQMTKIPWLVRELDGGDPVGFVHDVIMKPINDSNYNELNMFDKSLKTIYDMIENRSKDDRKRHNRTVYIEELEDTLTGPNLRGHQILAVALNTGNQSNLRKMMLGEGWVNKEEEVSFDNIKLQAILSHLNKNDVMFVQEVWDQMGILYPELAEVHRRTTGQTPPKIETTPRVFNTIDGEIEVKGGYYPLKEDPLRSARARENEKRSEESVLSMFTNGSSIQASVNAGATFERTRVTYPIKLSLEVIPEHFQEVIHFITHHDAVRQINKIIRNSEFEQAVVSVVGQDEFNQLAIWLNDVAKAGKNTPNKTFIDAAFGQLRMGVTLGIMGAKLSTGIIQVLGVTQTFAEVGMEHTFEGYKMTISNGYIANAFRNLFGSEIKLQSGMDFALERSQVLPHRVKTMDREIANVFNELGKSVDIASESKGLASGAINVIKSIRRNRALRKTQNVSMLHIALIQMYSVDLPAWHAAYNKGVSEWGDESRAARYADWVVENTQGSGSVKDMSQLMRNQGKIHTSFTMFMTFFSSLWNIMRGFGRDVKKGRMTATGIAAKIAFLFFIPNLIEMFIRGELTSDDDDEYDALQRYLLKTALYPAQSVPFYRDIASGITGDYGYTLNPVAATLEKGVEGGAGMIGAMLDEDKDVTLYQVKGVTKLLGAMFGVPGVSQVWGTGEHLYDVLEEGEDLTMKELSFGPDRK